MFHATVRQQKILENNSFPGQGKVRESCGWSGKFEFWNILPDGLYWVYSYKKNLLPREQILSLKSTFVFQSDTFRASEFKV